ncbi:rubredoxin-NAD(+) reductase, partial [Acinetobacter baumannii]
ETGVEEHDGELAAGFYNEQDKLIGFALLGRQLPHHRTEWLEKLNSCPSTV